MHSEGKQVHKIFWMMVIGVEESEKMAAIFHRYSNVLLKYAYSILQSYEEAEDCVAEVLNKVTELLNTSPERIENVNDRRTGNFLITITKNTAKNMLRSRGKVSMIPLEDIDFEAETEENRVEYLVVHVGETRKRMGEVLQEMDDKLRVPLILRYYHSFTIPEISRLLDMQENHVSVSIHRGKKYMKERLSTYDP